MSNWLENAFVGTMAVWVLSAEFNAPGVAWSGQIGAHGKVFGSDGPKMLRRARQGVTVLCTLPNSTQSTTDGWAVSS